MKKLKQFLHIVIYIVYGRADGTEGYIKYIKANNIAKRRQAQHDVENYKSGMVMQRAGMTKEGILRKYGSNNLHSRHDTAIYSILNEEIIL